MVTQEVQKKTAKLVSKAWSQKGFKERLLANPKAVMKEEGWTIPDGVEVKVVEGSDKVVYIVLPPPPKGLADEKLDVEGQTDDGQFPNCSITTATGCTS